MNLSFKKHLLFLSLVIAILGPATSYAADDGVVVIPLEPIEVVSVTTDIIKTQPQKLPAVLRHTYLTHPEIRSAEADLKAVIEEVAVAMSNYRPDISASASASTQHTEPSTFGSPSSNQQDLGLSLSQPIYRGGRTTAAVEAADNRILAQKSVFDDFVQGIFQDVITAYIDVIENQEILSLRENNESVLETQLEANRARFELGGTTLTDVSQAKSRLAAARAERIEASANLRSSHAVFERITGLAPTGLVMPEAGFSFDKTLNKLIEIALNNHPEIRAVHYETEARSQDAREILGQLLPEVSVNGSVNRSYNPTFGDTRYTDNSRLTLQATMPLYLGGEARARYRQAQYNRLSAQNEADDIAREIEQGVIIAWEDLQAAQAQVDARGEQVNAATISFEGVSEEQRFGARTTLDVLDAEQERFNARVDLVSAEFNEISAKYNLMASIGQLTPEQFGITDISAEITGFYQKTRSNWFGLDIDEE